MRIALPDLYKNLINPKITPDICYIFEKWGNRISRCIRQGSLHFLFTDAYDKIIIVAENSNNVIGFVEGIPISDKEWLINALAVLPNYRRKGIGQELVKRLISNLKNKGWKKVSLYVRSNNIPAIKFYQKLGFTIVKEKIHMSLDIKDNT